MEYAARLTRTPSRKALVAPLVALLVGAGVATGAYALIDNPDATSSQVIVVEQPGPHAAEIPGKNEAGTAAAISPQSQAIGLPRPDEAAVAAAISEQGGSVQPRGSKASDTGTSTTDRARDIRTDPRGTASALRNP